MFGQQIRSLGMIALGAGLLSILSVQARAEDLAPKQEPVKIGLMGTLFRDIPESTVAIMMQPFGTIMYAQTGVRGELVPGFDLDQLGEQLAADKIQLGVFHGVEFAWARQKHPELRPLCIAINQQRHLYAHVMVRADSSAASLKDLEGKPFAVARQTKEHCDMFIGRQCRLCKKEPAVFFARTTNPPNAEEALDDVIDGAVSATVVDGVTLECYKRRKPGRFTRLKELQVSEIFPAAVVAYRPGALNEDTLKRFRVGMITANNSILGKQLMTLWQLTGFESVPQDYEQTLTNIVKVYPAPAKTTK
jgi:ABC-type phosphate/phosphonate transport system substrate-binding protein